MRNPVVFTYFSLYIVVSLCVGLARSDITQYTSCQDVAQTLGQNATDGQYLINFKRNVGIYIYCSGK